LAVAEGYEVCQVFLGPKIYEGRRGAGELSEVLGQAVGAVFHFMETYQEAWESRTGSKPSAAYGSPFEPGEETVAINVERMLKGFRQGLRDLLPIWKVVLPPETLSKILPLGLVDDEEFRFPAPLWVQTVYDFALAYHEQSLHREHLVKSLTPLYLGRTASLVLETRDGGSDEVEQAIEALCQTFERMKPYLIDRWRFQ
ncbi:MAG TPA: glycosyl transferase family 2, partial [Nitrospirales bacterium]|nr:glycosyl transferase family 2 [Nitrospirales bacterium]